MWMGAYIICDLLLATSMDDDSDPTFLALIAVRFALAFAPLPDTLRYDQQLSSPLTSYPRCADVLPCDRDCWLTPSPSTRGHLSV